MAKFRNFLFIAKYRSLIIGLLIGITASFALSSLAAVSVPNVFNQTDKLTAKELNDNYLALQNAINQLEQQVSQLSGSASGSIHYPQLMTPTNTINIPFDAGSINYPGGDTVIMNGKNIVLPSFTGTANVGVTYHLRYHINTGWSLKDVTDATYNPSAVSEDDPVFDSTYNDMLVAKISNNSVVKLVNRDRLLFSRSSNINCNQSIGVNTQGQPQDANALVTLLTDTGDYSASSANSTIDYYQSGSVYYLIYNTSVNLNWARQPKLFHYSNSSGFFGGTSSSFSYGSNIVLSNRYVLSGNSAWALTFAPPASCLDLSVVMGAES